MTEAKYTPGPWKRNDFLDLKEISLKAITCERLGFCVTFINTDDKARVGEADANARLIAAAPELLEALILMVRTHEEPAETLLQETRELQWIEKARSAIAKATGN